MDAFVEIGFECLVTWESQVKADLEGGVPTLGVLGVVVAGGALMADHPQAPDERTEYHREGPLTIFDFGKLWLTHHQPPLIVGWRDLGGGWLRWVWFCDKDGANHALHVPSYLNSGEVTAKEKKILGFFLGWMQKYAPEDTPRSSRVENVLE